MVAVALYTECKIAPFPLFIRNDIVDFVIASFHPIFWSQNEYDRDFKEVEKMINGPCFVPSGKNGSFRISILPIF